MITLRDDFDAIAAILVETFKLPPLKRNYDEAFGKIAGILYHYGISENARNLRFRFILCMQEFFDGIPRDQWRVNDPVFVKQSEDFSITKFRQWVMEQIT